VKQWFDTDGNVRADYRDTTGNCKTDAWSYYEKGRLVRQGLDTQGRGRPDVLNHLNAEGAVVIQEATSNGRNPDKKLFLDAGGAVTAQCQLNESGDKLTTRAIFANAELVEILVDTTGNGIADQREVYRNGARVRLDADTNGDRKPDVVQSVAPSGTSIQEEDTDFDGIVDRRFEGDRLVGTAGDSRIPGAEFGRLGCGSFHRFWWKR
jgi:hypothetical protein